ncbi:hypothetical protein PAT3040_05930 [Paenibacillus agaridevorans]|uniref:Uncharacterized protein n=1 Tax=Paenibacillus agaridevorans TaxID=171404 RepID=A0A2R5EWQ6_9BACL|nr:hypothetical protein PAT3040_05930 [Paenibacillus agaridevorans]
MSQPNRADAVSDSGDDYASPQAEHAQGKQGEQTGKCEDNAIYELKFAPFAQNG